MSKKEKYLICLIGVISFLFIGYELQFVQQYIFFHREQQQLLMWDGDLLFERFHGVAGFSLFLAQFLTQFFCFPYVGTVITTVLALLSVLLLEYAVHKIAPSLWLYPLCLVPVIFELSNLSDAYYHYQGFVSFILLSLFIAVYMCWSGKLSANLRLLLGPVMGFVLWFLAGPAALPFAAFVVLVDALKRREKFIFQLVTPLVVVLVTFYGVRWCWLPSNRTAFSMDYYYNPLISTPTRYLFSWGCVLLLPVCYAVVCKIDKLKSSISRMFLSVALTTGVLGLAYYMAQRDWKDRDVLHEMQHHALAGEWDAILSHPEAQSKNYLIMNYVNLALSKKGLLLSHFFTFDQHDDQNIMVHRPVTDTNLPLSFIYSQVYYQMGNMGAAQNHAFDVFVGTTYGHPSMLQMLIKTNLVLGAYPVAEKYISLLERTWRYSDWARNMRRFLYNRKAIMDDPDLGLLTRDLAKDDTFTNNPFECLFKTLEANPEDRNARDYLIAYLYIYRDQDDINRFVENFYQTPALNPFPTSLQEAYLLVNDDVERCRQHGVSEENIARYERLTSMLDEAYGRGLNPAQTVWKEFGKTLWFQFLFN